MAEFSDQASFGVSDVGLTQYRTPAPSPTAIFEKDQPYQPIPLTVEYLDPYMLRVPGLKSEQFVPVGFEEYQFSFLDFPTIGKPLAERYPVKEVPYWYYKNDGTVLRDAEIVEGNAKILAARVLGGDREGVSEVVRDSVNPDLLTDRINAELPVLRREQERSFVFNKRIELVEELERKQNTTLNYAKQLAMGFGAAAVSIAFPPLAPFVLGAYGAYTLATTIPRQVETGRVNPVEVVGQVAAVAAVAGAGGIAYGKFNAPTVTTANPLPAIPSVQFPAPQAAQLSNLNLGVIPTAGPSITAMQLGLASVPASFTGLQLGISQAQLLEATRPTTIDRAIASIVDDPAGSLSSGAKYAGIGKTVFERIQEGDYGGIFGIALQEAGSPVSIPNIVNAPDIPLPARLSARPYSSPAIGGGYAVEFQPADPASENTWLYLFGGILLVFMVYGILKKG